MQGQPQRQSAGTAVPDFLSREIESQGQRVTLEPGSQFLKAGEDVDVFAVLTSGSLRVYAMGENGREITLYGVEPGECCMVNVLCLISDIPSPATAVAEETTEAVIFSRETFLKWLDQRADMRAFVFGITANRVGTMMALVEEVAFQRLDCRLAGYLVQRVGQGTVLATTHDAIAADLGTAREVVSRLLKSFERQHAVKLARGSITVTNAAFLARLASGV